MSSKIYIVGMGPGTGEMMTPQADQALCGSDVIVGYPVYLKLLGGKYRKKEFLSTPMKQEVRRCEMCFEEAEKGKTVAISNVSDPTFGEEILGKGVAIIPAEGRIYAPADGTIEMLFDTMHAVSMTTSEGVELLIHIGLDTVALKGEHFTAYKGNGDSVKKGELLIEADLDAVKKAGYDVITPVVVCNTSDYQTVETVTDQEVEPGDTVLILNK